MTSLFEHVRGMEIPVDLVARELRGVSLLEFLPVARTEAHEVQEAPAAEPEFAVDERALQVAAMIDAARVEAGAAMRMACAAEMTTRVDEERARAARLGAEFASDRERYFAGVEEQVVKLALAVAKRILLREVEVDRMWLRATVRAALTRVSDGSRTVLRVHPGEALDWVEVGLADVDVVGDELVPKGECVVETSVGRVELGVRPQMDEMELAFAGLPEQLEA